MELLLQVKDLVKTYKIAGKEFQALAGVSLEIFRGEILGLLGVNGAGKTTLSSILGTFHPPTSGEVSYQGKSIYQDLLNYRSIIGYCPQKPNLDSMLTVRENLVFAGRYFLKPEDYIQGQVEKLLERFHLTKYADAQIKQLSGGYRQRVSIARALMNQPQLVVFDEPTVALDPHIRREIWQIIKDLKQEGITVLLTTHYLDEAEILSDRVCILEKGKVKFIDTPDNLKKAHAKERLEDVFLHIMDGAEKEEEDAE